MKRKIAPGATYTAEELGKMLDGMRTTSSIFYGLAIRVGNHAFIEFCGLMNKYIDVCERARQRGQDFTLANVHAGDPLPVESHDVDYLAEKFECIFGTTLADPKLRAQFIKRMGWNDERGRA